MHPLIQRLILDHKRLLILLKVLKQQLDDFQAGSEHDLDLACELIQYLQAYENLVHHPVEELIFSKFLARLETDHNALQNAMQQHRLLTTMTHKFHNTLESIIQGVVIPRAEVNTQGQNLLKNLFEHVQLEELQIFPELNSGLTHADWLYLEDQVTITKDPLFEHPDSNRFRNLLNHLTTIATNHNS